MSSFYEFAVAALPWIAMGLLLGIAIGLSKEKESDK